MPRALASRPTLKEGSAEYLSAFNHLDSARGMYAEGLLAITIGEVLAYCTLARIPTGESALRFLRIMQGLDTAKLNYWHQKTQRAK